MRSVAVIFVDSLFQLIAQGSWTVCQQVTPIIEFFLDQFHQEAFDGRGFGVAVYLGMDEFRSPFPHKTSGLAVFAGDAVSGHGHMVNLHPFPPVMSIGTILSWSFHVHGLAWDALKRRLFLVRGAERDLVISPFSNRRFGIRPTVLALMALP